MLPVRYQNSKTTPAVRDPFADLAGVTRGLASIADDLWTQVAGDDAWTALADVEETDDEFVVDVELPGVEKGDVDVALDGRRLTISAERKERERVGVLRHRTRRVGTYRFDVLLPAEVDDERIEANLTDGVLTVHVPKTVSARRRRIQVT